jgi:hypothetical protein
LMTPGKAGGLPNTNPVQCYERRLAFALSLQAGVPDLSRLGIASVHQGILNAMS